MRSSSYVANPFWTSFLKRKTWNLICFFTSMTDGFFHAEKAQWSGFDIKIKEQQQHTVELPKHPLVTISTVYTKIAISNSKLQIMFHSLHLSISSSKNFGGCGTLLSKARQVAIQFGRSTINLCTRNRRSPLEAYGNSWKLKTSAAFTLAYRWHLKQVRILWPASNAWTKIWAIRLKILASSSLNWTRPITNGATKMWNFIGQLNHLNNENWAVKMPRVVPQAPPPTIQTRRIRTRRSWTYLPSKGC